MLKKGKGYKSRLAGQARIVRANFVSALPVICFFLFLFYTVILIFGAQYTMVVSLATLLFQTNYRQRKSWDSLVHMALVQLAISVAAYLATLSFPLSVGLNLVLPFGLVFLRTSRFNKMGYFSGLMTFTFLQLIPLDFQGFLIQTGAFVYSLIWFFVLVKLYQKMYPARSDYSRQQEGLRLLADCLRQQLDGQEKSPEMLRDIYRLQQLQYQETYAKRGSRQIATREGKIAYMFALLFQRASYFISCRFEPSMLEDSGTRELLERTAACLAQAAQARFWEREARAALREEGEGILEMAEASEDELHHSVSSFLIPFLIILRKFDERDADEQGAEWLMPRHQRPLGKLRFQMKPDGFEMRFALRMSAVLTLSFLFVHVSGADRAYWLPLNAFLLLRPMYEDSRYRMLTRFIGTARRTRKICQRCTGSCWKTKNSKREDAGQPASSLHFEL